MKTTGKPSVLSSILNVLIIALPVIVITQLLGFSIGTSGVGVIIGILYAFIRYRSA